METMCGLEVEVGCLGFLGFTKVLKLRTHLLPSMRRFKVCEEEPVDLETCILAQVDYALNLQNSECVWNVRTARSKLGEDSPQRM